MGHERVGALPHSRPWRNVVAQISNAASSEGSGADVANSTLDNVQARFRHLNRDEGVKAAFEFLIALSSGSSSTNIDLSSNPSPLGLAMELRDWVRDHRESIEYADIAQKAATDTIVRWSEQRTEQRSLFGDQDHATEIWRSAGNGTGFCEVSRLFFAKFTERYLNYFLEREASAELTSIEDRDRFSSRLREHIDQVSRYAFETSRITQSFAAGWFNQHVRSGMPSDHEIEGFLYVAFGKIREELLREGSAK